MEVLPLSLGYYKSLCFAEILKDELEYLAASSQHIYVQFHVSLSCIDSFKKLSIGISEVGTCIFEVPFKVTHNDMSLQGHIQAKVFIRVIKICSEVE